MSEPNKTEKAVVAAQDAQASDSVLDFLYYDSRRISSFLAQFDPSGHLQQIRHIESSGGTSTNETTKAMGLTHGLKIDRGSSSKATEQENNAFERTYDPLWGNALQFLDYLGERGLIKEDLGSASIGQIVLAQGEISILDLATVAEFWNKPTIRKQVLPQTQKSKGSPQTTAAELAMDTISILPHGLQTSMTSSGRKIWGTLRQDSLSGSANDLLLKHGAKIAGSWSMLGILDAKPDSGAQMHMPDISGKIQTEGFTAILEALGPITRLLLGRPNAAFGVTPLLIYRKVGT